jgi:signal recognition particle GTPase
MENFESTLKDLVWKLIQEEVKVEVTRQRHAELTESDNDNDNDNERLTEDRVNELIGEYINYNVTVSIEA